MRQYILAHDLGTSGNKATLYTLEGALHASTVVEYPTYYPQPGFVEQDPSDWWRAVCSSTRLLLENGGVFPEQIACVCFSGQMMGCLLVDKDGIPLHNMLIWADTRAQEQEHEMERRLGMDFVYRTTGHRISASYSAAKLLWIKQHEPQLYARAHKMLHAKDYVIFRMTGRIATDYSDASGTNLFDIAGKRWSEDILRELSIDPALMPEAHPSTHLVGGVTAQGAAECGLQQGTPVILGGGDGSCACVGAGVVRQGSAYCVLGSSSWISLASAQPLLDAQMRTFNWVHLDERLYTPCGTMQAAGYSYRWFRDALCTQVGAEAGAQGKSTYERINQDVAASPPGAGGLMYLPYLLGERSPRWNLDARGAFVGLSVTSTKGDMARAVLEGVGMNLKIILDVLSQAQAMEKVSLIGGGAKGAVWRQILADIWQKPLLLPAHPEEATSMGAAVCGGVGIGVYPDFTVMDHMQAADQSVTPQAELAPLYDALCEAFNQAYEGLLRPYATLAAMREHPAPV